MLSQQTLQKLEQLKAMKEPQAKAALAHIESLIELKHIFFRPTGEIAVMGKTDYLEYHYKEFYESTDHIPKH